MIHLGDYRETLRGLYGAMIVDPPYSGRVHARQATIAGEAKDGYERSDLDYAHWTSADCDTLAEWASRHVTGWWVVLCCSELYASHRAAAEARNRYVFAPLPLIIPGMTVRLSGDGPSSECVWACVSRPSDREFSDWGTLRGYHLATKSGLDREWWCTGGKPLALMTSLVRDYSRPGDLIVDPCAGHGTTLVAARAMERMAVGSEIDPGRHAVASRRLGMPYQGDLLAALT